MTAPAYVGTPTTSGSSSLSTTHSITLPSGIVAGDRICIFARFHMDQNSGTFTVTTPSGYGLITGLNPGPSGVFARIIDRYWRKTADGTESGTTVSVTTNVVAVSAMVAVRESIFGFDGLTGIFTPSFTGLDPSALSWSGAETWDTLSTTWLACVATDPTNDSPTPPTGYTLLADIYSPATGFGGGTHNGHARVSLAHNAPGVVHTVDPDAWSGYVFGTSNTVQPFHGIEHLFGEAVRAYWGILATAQ